MDGQKDTRVRGLSKLTKIEDLRIKLEEAFDVPPSKQRLFFKGKQVINYQFETHYLKLKQLFCQPFYDITATESMCMSFKLGFLCNKLLKETCDK